MALRKILSLQSLAEEKLLTPKRQIHLVEKPIEQKAVKYLTPSEDNPILKNPFQEEPPKARRKALEVVMGEMVQNTCDRIVEEHKKRGILSYKSISEIEKAEKAVTRIFHEILDGKATITDCKQACNNWVNVVMANIGEYENVK